MQVGTVRAASLARVPDVLAGFGVALDPLLGEAGLPRTLLDDAETPVELSRGIRFLALAAERTGCPHVGLLCGQSLPIEALGIVGQVARNANDVGTGLRGLILNLHLHGHAFVPVLTVTAGLAEFVLRLAPDVDENTDPAVDLGMAIAWTVLRTLCGPDWKPVEVSLARRAPPAVKPTTGASGRLCSSGGSTTPSPFRQHGWGNAFTAPTWQDGSCSSGSWP